MNFDSLIEWLQANTQDVLLMGIVGSASFIVLMWGRRRLLRWWLQQLQAFGNLVGNSPPFDTFRVASIAWVVFLSTYLAALFAPAAEPWVPVTERILLSGFILTTGASAARFARRLAHVIGEQHDARRQTVELVAAVPTAGLVIITALGILQTWGAQIAPLLLSFSVVGVVLVLGFRDYFPTLVASLQVQGRGIEPGRYVRLESGVEGTVTDVSWRSTVIETPAGNLVHVLTPHWSARRSRPIWGDRGPHEHRSSSLRAASFGSSLACAHVISQSWPITSGPCQHRPCTTTRTSIWKNTST